jgi:hypothetical protein
MHIRTRPEVSAAILLGGVAVLNALLGGSGRTPLLQPPELALPAPGSEAGKTLTWCRGNVAIIHDMYWASACSVVAQEQRQRGEAGDDSPECTLPHDRAWSLNTARAKAEQQCLEEATAMAGR